MTSKILAVASDWSSRVVNSGRLAWLSLTGVEALSGVRIGPSCEVALGRRLARRGKIILGHGTHLERGVILHPYAGKIELGDHVYLGPYTIIYGHGGVTIGRDTLVAMHCRIVSSNHGLPPDQSIRSVPDEPLATRIGADVWLGAGVTVLGGVTIGDGAVVGAGAVVTSDVQPKTIVAGVPARLIGHR